MLSLERYQSINSSFLGDLKCNQKSISLDTKNINLIDGKIPNFIDKDLDQLNKLIDIIKNNY